MPCSFPYIPSHLSCPGTFCFLKARTSGNKKKDILLLSTIYSSPTSISIGFFSPRHPKTENGSAQESHPHSILVNIFLRTEKYPTSWIAHDHFNCFYVSYICLWYDMVCFMFFIVSLFPNFTRFILARATALCLFLLYNLFSLKFHLFFNSGCSSTPTIPFTKCQNWWIPFILYFILSLACNIIDYVLSLSFLFFCFGLFCFCFFGFVEWVSEIKGQRMLE